MFVRNGSGYCGDIELIFRTDNILDVNTTKYKRLDVTETGFTECDIKVGEIFSVSLFQNHALNFRCIWIDCHMSDER